MILSLVQFRKRGLSNDAWIYCSHAQNETTPCFIVPYFWFNYKFNIRINDCVALMHEDHNFHIVKTAKKMSRWLYYMREAVCIIMARGIKGSTNYAPLLSFLEFQTNFSLRIVKWWAAVSSPLHFNNQFLYSSWYQIINLSVVIFWPTVSM